MITNSFSLEQFISSNTGKKVNELDYLSVVVKSAGLSSDFILAFARLFSPKLLIEENLIFLAQEFDKARLNSLVSSQGSMENAQTWLNLVEITGIFDNLSFNDGAEMANIIANGWNNEIAKQKAGLGKARVIVNSDQAEIFLTIDCK